MYASKKRAVLTPILVLLYPYSHLAGGMKYQDGKLTVPTTGRYFIYVQAYCRSKGRISVHEQQTGGPGSFPLAGKR